MLPEVHFYKKAHLTKRVFFLGFRPFRALRGAWNCFIPKLNIKLAYPRNGNINCLRKAAPDYAELMSGKFDGQQIGRYTAEDWKNAFGKSARLRAVENYIAAHRLHQAGLGPKPLGLCYVKSFSYSLFGPKSETAGILIENAYSLPTKPDATDEEILAAGVTIDGIRSCVRQQVNGYVTDLNSVQGVMPVNAEEEIQQMLREFSEKIDAMKQNS